MKKSIMGEVDKFFDSRERYQRLKVPWKRGVIYYGPPGRLHAAMLIVDSVHTAMPKLTVQNHR